MCSPGGWGWASPLWILFNLFTGPPCSFHMGSRVRPLGRRKPAGTPGSLSSADLSAPFPSGQGGRCQQPALHPSPTLKEKRGIWLVFSGKPWPPEITS